jgi:arginine decarboxylase
MRNSVSPAVAPTPTRLFALDAAPLARAAQAMRISVSRGVGTGPTPLASFDAALMAAGIHDYNLIPLSSVIPPGAVLERTPHVAPPEDYGRRLYVVLAHETALDEGATAAAGLGWVREPGDGRGLFVEAHGSSEDEVRRLIDRTLVAMTAARGREYGPVESELVSAKCTGEPVCALVTAVYASVPWE